jgi:DNA-directed RNA polymerase subunit E'/Rpb7
VEQEGDATVYANRSVFYSKAYLINRRLHNEVRFRIDGVEVKKPNSLVAVRSLVASRVLRIDATDGRVFVNRTELAAQGFTIDDRIRVRVQANLYALTGAPLSDNESDNDQYVIDNTMTRLEVHLTNYNASVLMILNNMDMKQIQTSYLNPSDGKYISRSFGAVGYRPVVQDVIEPSFAAASLRVQPYHLLVQFSNLSDSSDNVNTFDSAKFLAALKQSSLKVSSSLDDRNVEFKAARSVVRAEGSDFYDLFDLSRPFYMSWLFWVLAFIGFLLFVIMVMFVFCIKLSVKQKSRAAAKKKSGSTSGLIVQYPPGVNPVFQDGLLRHE